MKVADDIRLLGKEGHADREHELLAQPVYFIAAHGEDAREAHDVTALQVKAAEDVVPERARDVCLYA